MDIQEFDATISKLEGRVGQLINKPGAAKNAEVRSLLPSIDIKSAKMYYMGIPLLIILVLYITKPNFIMEEVSIDGELPENRLSYKKLLLSTLVATVIIAIVIFIYFFKNPNSKSTSETGKSD